MTPVGEGGIGIVRVTGPAAVRIADALFVSARGRRVADAAGGKLLYGQVVREGERLDEVVVRAPTRETVDAGRPVVDINCHGGIAAVRRVLEAALGEGAKRGDAHALARLAVGVDAIQREAELVLPRALTRRAAHALLAQRCGALSKELRRAAALLDEANRERSGLENALAGIEAVLGTAQFGVGLWRPRRLVVAGRPNVGKSTLVNALLDEERVIVHPEPGTTRDAIEAIVSIEDLPFVLVDTAGLRRTEDAVEILGVEKARREIVRADILLLLVDASEPTDDTVADLVASAAASACVLALNKCDLPIRADLRALESLARGGGVLQVSALRRTGLRRLERRILLQAGVPDVPEEAPLVFTERQETLLGNAAGFLRKALLVSDVSACCAASQSARARIEECLEAP